VALFEKQSRSTGGDADLKSYAAKTLPTLKEHLQMLQGSKTAGMGTGMVMKN
jgi:predicted outer membrane protein